jgi:hypothetical protein
MWKPTLLLDFDGVLHSYTSGWVCDEEIPDPPVPGAVEFVTEALERFEVVVHSGRCKSPEGIAAIEAWLAKWGFPPIPVLDYKPAAFLSIDDRAICFTGTWPDVAQLTQFKPWWDHHKPGEI